MSHTFAPFARLEGIDAVPTGTANVAPAERIGSVIAGTALVSYGVIRRDLTGALLGIIGGLLVHRGASGRCKCYEQLGVDTTGASDGRGVPGNAGTRAEHTIEVSRSPMELYHFWHQLSHLPEVMPHVKSVAMDGSRSHWIVAGPAGRDVEWDAEFINEIPGELIAWQSLPGAEVHHAGSVRFEPLGDGTRLKVALEYSPPGGKAGALVAYLFGVSPQHQLEIDLARFKERMETAQ